METCWQDSTKRPRIPVIFECLEEEHREFAPPPWAEEKPAPGPLDEISTAVDLLQVDDGDPHSDVSSDDEGDFFQRGA